ncbi:hypothetical protein GOBAR_DD01539 [Gossypium barbadense]|nr:hypothetical protein GOBAR_DD01539 [Gossypium barbadense]
MTKLFYKFSVSSNPIKFTEMELLDDDEVETMVALYCPSRRSSVHSFDIDLDIRCSNQYGGGLQIHLVVIEIDVLGEDGSDNNDCSDHEVENPSRGIIIHNNLEAHMLITDPDIMHASEFPEYLDIITGHQMLEDLESEKLFMGQRFTSKDECVDAIKRYSLKDHRKLDLKTICNCILAMVKDDPTIAVSALITEMQEWFHYRVLYRKAWLAKQMAID